MGTFHTVNSLVVSRNLWLILLRKILLFFNLVKHFSKYLITLEYSKSSLIFSLALVVVELLVILEFFTRYKLQNISGTHDDTCWQKLAADLS
jgi:hypothetical protein